MRFSLYLTIAVCSIVTCLSSNSNTHADLIIFSFDRPMQVYALLESVHKYISHLNKVYVLYRTTNSAFDAGYEEIQATFPWIKFVKQGPSPRQDFKPLLLECFYGSDSEYILFAVDDDIVKNYVDMSQCVQAMANTGAHGFYLRLGTNIERQYPNNYEMKQPAFKNVAEDIYLFNLKEGSFDWAYPHNVDMTLFKKSSIQQFIMESPYTSPNTLEGYWAGVAPQNDFGLCYKFSKKFTMPLNIVQQDWQVPNENSFTVNDLLRKWQKGWCIDINQLSKIKNKSVFIKNKPNFVKRVSK